jgi:hypothetical protein
MYKLRPTKGFVEETGLRYIAIDPAQMCIVERCPVFDLCVYSKNSRERCEVEIRYLDAVMKSLADMIGKDITQAVQNKITLHLLPLFQQLVRFQIEAYGVHNVLHTTPRGSIMVHPIFKEIRETIKAIENTQKSMGIDGEYIQALELTKSGMRRIGQHKDKGMAELDFRERWNDESFREPLGLRPESERPVRAAKGGNHEEDPNSDTINNDRELHN